jgi:hypothetical protein
MFVCGCDDFDDDDDDDGKSKMVITENSTTRVLLPSIIVYNVQINYLLFFFYSILNFIRNNYNFTFHMIQFYYEQKMKFYFRIK